MSNIGSTTLPIFRDTSKFNGINWITWRSNIQIAADFKSVIEYLDGSILRPSIQSQQSPPAPFSIPPSSPSLVVLQISLTLLTPIETPWDSLNPTPSEWKVCNAWAMGLLIYNTTNCHKLHLAISPSNLWQFPVSMAPKSPWKDLLINTSHVSKRSIVAEILGRSTGNHYGTVY